MSTRIALLGPANLRYVREVFLGVAEYASAHPGWQLRLDLLRPKLLPRLRRWQPHGGIAMFEDAQRIGEWQEGAGGPLINVGDPWPAHALPVVRSDDAAIGRMVAAHFRERGYRRFGFAPYAVDRLYFSTAREAAFRQAVGNDFYSLGPSGQGEPLARWLRDLPKPCAVFAANDHRAGEVAEVAHDIGVRVPEDVALIGADNDELICSLNMPTLSSLDPGSRAVGWEAARQLDRMLRGEAGPVPNEPLVVPPVNIVVRASSDTVAIEDREIADAVRFIRSNAHRPLSVSDVLEEVPISRRALERRFRSIFGHGPADEIRGLRVRRAQDLLATTDLPMPKVAEASGFTSAVQLSIVFRRVTGRTPTDYRRASTTDARAEASTTDAPVDGDQTPHGLTRAS